MLKLVEQGLYIGLYIKVGEERAYRNRTRVEFMCVVHNIKRGLSIRQTQ
jgi:hypothetical protein